MANTPGWFLLTDGMADDLAPGKFFFTEEELNQANDHARQATDGNLWWTPEFPLPIPHRTGVLRRIGA